MKHEVKGKKLHVRVLERENKYNTLDFESYEDMIYAVMEWLCTRRFNLDIYRYFDRIEFSKNL